MGEMGESLGAREVRVSELADSWGFTLEKHGAGSPITSLEYSLVDKETFSIAVDGHDGLDPIEIFLTDIPKDHGRPAKRLGK
jgi:hypothetical protein